MSILIVLLGLFALSIVTGMAMGAVLRSSARRYEIAPATPATQETTYERHPDRVA